MQVSKELTTQVPVTYNPQNDAAHALVANKRNPPTLITVPDAKHAMHKDGNPRVFAVSPDGKTITVVNPDGTTQKAGETTSAKLRQLITQGQTQPYTTTQQQTAIKQNRLKLLNTKAAKSKKGLTVEEQTEREQLTSELQQASPSVMQASPAVLKNDRGEAITRLKKDSTNVILGQVDAITRSSLKNEINDSIENLINAGVEEEKVYNALYSDNPIQGIRELVSHIPTPAPTAETPSESESKGDVLANNASGESAASIEAQNRVKSESGNDQTRYIIDTRTGKVIAPVANTVDAVDKMKVDPFHAIIQKNVGADTFTVVTQGTKAKPVSADTIKKSVGSFETESSKRIEQEAKEITYELDYEAGAYDTDAELIALGVEIPESLKIGLVQADTINSIGSEENTTETANEDAAVNTPLREGTPAEVPPPTDTPSEVVDEAVKAAEVGKPVPSPEAPVKPESKPVEPAKPETDKGVAMYSRGNTGVMQSSKLTRQELEDYAKTVIGDNKKQPGLNVVQSVSELPFDAPADTQGVYRGGVIYLIADNITGTQDAAEVIAHEFIGHFGLRGFFGTALNDALNLIHKHNLLVRQYAEEWKNNNIDVIRDQKLIGDEVHYRAVEEAMSRMASEGKGFSYALRLVRVIQSLLRQIGKHEWANRLESKTNAEALQMLRKSELYIKHGITENTPIPEPLYPLFLSAWHGSPHDFEKFSTDRIGTGEGAQAYG